MHPFPHTYRVHGVAETTGSVRLRSHGLPELSTAPPTEFGGPGDQWSPETLLVGAIADCYVLSFRAVAAASKFPWVSLACDVDGVLDRVDGVTRFTEIMLRPVLRLGPGGDVERGRRLLEKAEKVCLIMNSLKATTSLLPDVQAWNGEESEGPTS